MKLKIYSIKDNLAGFYQPTFEQSDEIAIRNFAFAVNKKDNLLFASPDDFSLYHIGVLDTELGIITPCDPVLVVQASSVIDRSNKNG